MTKISKRTCQIKDNFFEIYDLMREGKSNEDHMIKELKGT